MSSSHPFGSRRDRSFFPEFIYAGSINCDFFNMSVLHPDFWYYVSCRRERITNPWLQSLSKAQHCLLKRRRRKKILRNVFLKPWSYPTSLPVSFLDWRGHDSFPLQPSSSMLVCWDFLQSSPIILFSIFSVFLQRSFSAPGCAFWFSLLLFLEQCLSQIHVVLCWR